MLLSLTHNLIVNTTTVKTIEPIGKSPEGYPRCRISFVDGTHEVILGRFDKLEALTGPIIPAPSGFQVIKAYPSEAGGQTFDHYPVVAFRLADGDLVPVAPWALLDDHGWALVWPDGRCESIGDQLFANVDEFKASFEPGEKQL